MCCYIDAVIYFQKKHFSLENHTKEHATKLAFFHPSLLCFARDTIFLFVTNIFQKFSITFNPNELEPILESEVGFFRRPLPYSIIMKNRLVLLYNKLRAICNYGSKMFL